MVFTTGLLSNSENYCDVKLTLNPFFYWVEILKTRANRRELSSGLCATNSFTGRSISTQLCLHSRLSPLFLESTCKKKKEKKLWQYPAIFSSRLAKNAYILNYFKDAHNVVQVLLSLRVFKPIKFCFYCTKFMQMKKKAKRTDEFDPMRDKNDLKERFLGQNFTQNPWYWNF